MSHILLFIGATPALSSELKKLEKRFSSLTVLAPASAKGHRGISRDSIEKGIEALTRHMLDIGPVPVETRFSLWSYHPNGSSEFSRLWDKFGSSAWVEFIPNRLLDNINDTRVYIETQTKAVLQSIHEVSYSVYNKRKTSPLCVPLRNFRSQITSQMADRWYATLSIDQLRNEISNKQKRFRQIHIKQDGCALDDRSLCFSPAKDTECHGIPHPTGERECFIAGRFRFGSAIYSGFHYDVTQPSKNLDCVLYDCSGNARELKSERRSYINIYPNDHILPKK